MCGYKFNQPRRLRLRVPWADIILALVLVALVALWWRWDDQRQALALTPSFTPTTTPTATNTPTRTPTPTLTPTPTPVPTPTPIVHTVRQGDTYLGIANQYGIDLDALLAANNLTTKDVLRPGQTLNIPADEADAPLPTPEPLSGLINYPVEPGDTIQAIAIRFQIDPTVILENNDISDPKKLQVGQVLIIPVGTITPAPEVKATATPAPRVQPPTLISPPDGGVYAGETGPLLRWVATGLLLPDVWYQVGLTYADPHLPEIDPIRTKASSIRLDDALRPPPDATSSEIRWWVRLVRITRDGETVPVSETSPVRRFEWR
jgi:LysM repeat protein